MSTIVFDKIKLLPKPKSTRPSRGLTPMRSKIEYGKHGTDYGISGDMYWVQGKYLTESGCSRVEVQLRMAVYRPDITDLMVREYPTAKSRVVTSTTIYPMYECTLEETYSDYKTDAVDIKNIVDLPDALVPIMDQLMWYKPNLRKFCDIPRT